MLMTVGWATMWLTSCSNDDEPQTQAAQREIRLSSSVGDATRSNDATNLLSGDTVYVWTDMVNPSTTPATVTE